MPQYIVEVSEANDQKLRAQFPDPSELFRKVVVDAVQAEDAKLAEEAKPVVVRLSEDEVAVAVNVLEGETLTAASVAALGQLK